MNQRALFAAYYAQYRTEATTPANSDDEAVVFTALANEAINRWANYDNTFWKELWNTLQISGDGDLTLTEGQNEYTCPDDMRLAGGYVRVYNAAGMTQFRLPIVEPQDAQFRGDNALFAYFIGDPNNGFTLVINGTVTADMDGLSINYVYYKKPTLFTEGSDDDLPEMSQPYFIVHRALANRFRGSRNPYYQSAKNDGEDVLKTMQMENNSGTWADPWKLADNSSGRFGE